MCSATESMSSSPSHSPALAQRALQVRIAILIAPVLVACFVYGDVLDAGFAFDDPIAVTQNPLVTGELGPTEAFTRNVWADRPGYEHVPSWRPLTVLSLRLDHVMGDGKPATFHGTNLFLFVVLILAALALALRLGLPPPIASVMGVAIAVHPVFSEAVCSVVGRGDLLALALGCLGLWAWLRHPRVGLCLLAAALLAKESAVVFMAAAFVLAAAEGRRPAASALVVLGALWLGLRALVVGVAAGDVSLLDNPIGGQEGAHWIADVLAVMGRYLGWWLAPQPIAPDYAAGVYLPDHFHAFTWLGGLAIPLGGAWAVRSARHRDAPLLVALTIALTSLVLLSNGVATLPTPLAGRLAAIPALGLTLGAAVVASRLTPRRQWLALGIVAAWLGAGLPSSASQVAAWQSDRALFAHAVDVLPDSARGRINHAKQLLDAGEAAQAEVHLRAALARVQDHPLALQNLAVALGRQGRLQEAFEVGERAVALAPRPGQARANLCDLAVRRETLHGARLVAICKAAVAAKPEAAEPAVNLGRAHARVGQYVEAEAAFRAALGDHPDSVFAQGHRVTFLLSRGRVGEAVDLQKRLAAQEPQVRSHRRNLIALTMQHAQNLLTGGEWEAACAAAREAVALAPGAAPLRARMGQICAVLDRPSPP